VRHTRWHGHTLFACCEHEMHTKDERVGANESVARHRERARFRLQPLNDHFQADKKRREKKEVDS
jgi:hypothetical protein